LVPVNEEPLPLTMIRSKEVEAGAGAAGGLAAALGEAPAVCATACGEYTAIAAATAVAT